MDQVDKRKLKKTAGAIWKLIRGSLHYRFARYLVGAGVLLLAGPPLLHAVLIHVFGIAVDQIGYELSQFWDNAIKWVGIALIVTGISTFFFGERRPKLLDDSFDFTIPDGWSFGDVMRTIARGRVLSFDGFSDEELATPLAEKELIAKNMIEALGLMRSDEITPTLPSFDVYDEGSQIIIRRQNADKEENSKASRR